ncbi:MAG: AzlC family ABC transporter permease [Eubacterium sp.]|nr:AzlC family ABC transporter permease [Eubacterium sp.]
MENTSITLAKGLRDGIPIGLGYLSVAFTFGMMAVDGGLPIWSAVLISATNLTSAGQFAGLALILSGGSFLEMALTQLVINLRYALMSLSLSQKLDPAVNTLERMAIAFVNTDEIFAVSSGQPGRLTKGYMFGLAVMPYIGWTGGTLIGAAASTILPAFIRSALGIAIYGMFIAIFIPPAKKQKSVRVVLAAAVFTSCVFAFVPVLNTLSSGFVIIICTLAAAALGAVLFPIEEGGSNYE